MNQRKPLPEQLRRGPFLVRDGVAVVGSGKRLRASDLDRSIWGTRFVGDPDLIDRCRLFQTRMPRTAFVSHDTAALIWGMPLPPWPRPFVHMSVPRPERAPHAAGLAGHQLAVDPTELTTYRGVRLTVPARTWLDLWDLPLGDLVAAGDFLIHHDRVVVSRERIEAALRHRVSRRGLRKLWRALELLSDRAESPQESRLRVILAEAGFTLLANIPLYDNRGRFLARPDLRIEELKLVIEYLGDYHRDKRQWRADVTRRTRVEAEGWRVFEVVADDLLDPDDLVRRIRAAAALPPLRP